jgi:hypothetical protein
VNRYHFDCWLRLSSEDVDGGQPQLYTYFLEGSFSCSILWNMHFIVLPPKELSLDGKFSEAIVFLGVIVNGFLKLTVNLP